MHFQRRNKLRSLLAKFMTLRRLARPRSSALHLKLRFSSPLFETKPLLRLCCACCGCIHSQCPYRKILKLRLSWSIQKVKDFLSSRWNVLRQQTIYVRIAQLQIIATKVTVHQVNGSYGQILKQFVSLFFMCYSMYCILRYAISSLFAFLFNWHLYRRWKSLRHYGTI